MRAFNTFCTSIVHKGIEHTNYRTIFMGNVILPQLFLVAKNFFVVFILLYLGADAVDGLLAVIPENVLHALGLLGNTLPAVGMAMLLKFNISGNWMFIFFVLGFMMMSVMGMSFIAIGIVAAAIAFFYYLIEKNDQPQVAGVSAAADDDEEL